MAKTLEEAAAEVKAARENLQAAENERMVAYTKADASDRNLRFAQERFDEARRALSDIAAA